VSLDFELAWGVHDSLGRDGSYRSHLLGAREAVPALLDAFARHDVAATWATVGFLFAESRDELEAHAPPPELRPAYGDPRRDPYRLPRGESERDDPLSYAPSLIRSIAAAPRQEVGSHTFSHYYCLEPGQTLAAFRADLRAAASIAAARNVRLRSLVVPRHQVREDYLPAIAEAGFTVHRRNEANPLARPRASGRDPLWVRGARLLDAYVPLTGANAVPWSSLRRDRHGLSDVRESRFLRPASRRLAALEPLRTGRIVRAMREAARRGAVLHLWWHPHNFGVDLARNLRALNTILGAYGELRDDFGFVSSTMSGAAERAEGAAPVDAAGPGRAGGRSSSRPAPGRGSTDA
jgi:peptidoglycan/xylan/chitin deacetylase (PgdA/CDA1 family)